MVRISFASCNQLTFPCHTIKLFASHFALYEKASTPGYRVLLALDDTSAKRYGREVEGAGIHHNPTPGPAQQKLLIDHCWVVLGTPVKLS